MTALHTILVTGSRLFAETAEGKEWARSHLREHLGRLPSDSVVLHGGAAGVDSFAGDVANDLGLRWVAYLPNGLRLANYESERRWSPKAVHPLARNRKLVQCLLAAQRAGHVTSALGLVHMKSPTSGTGMTLLYLAEAGFEPVRLDYHGG